MFPQLFFKEFKFQLRNITVYLFLGIVILFYFSQFAPPDMKSSLKPSPKAGIVQSENGPVTIANPYGSTAIKDPEEEMKAVCLQLYRDLTSGSVFKHGFMINRNQKLSSEQMAAIRDALKLMVPGGFDNKEIKVVVAYKDYLRIVRGIDRKLGGSTDYSDRNRRSIAQRPKTYEEAVAEYREILEKDKLTNAYARVFADYMGITAGFFPVFLSAFILTRDKRNRMHELIYSRRITSVSYVFSKYASLVAVILLSYLLPATHATYVFARLADINGYSINYLAFYEYTIAWILPTILFSTAVGMLISVVFNNGLAAIPVQFILWALSMLPLSGDYRLFRSVIRFNELGNYGSFMDWLPQIALNRVFFTVISIALILFTAVLWSWKRGAVGGHLAEYFKRSSI